MYANDNQITDWALLHDLLQSFIDKHFFEFQLDSVLSANPTQVNILTQPTVLNPLLVREEKAVKYKHKFISTREWTENKNALLAKRWEKNRWKYLYKIKN